jgi:hypothetical protein
MKQVLVSALLLLGLAIAADRERASSEVAGSAGEGELALVQVYSTALGHAPAAMLTAEALSSIHHKRNKLQARALNARGLVKVADLHGLLAAAFAQDGELLGVDTYRPGVEAGEVARLSEWCESLPKGALFVVTRRGSMAPESADASGLEALFTGWGAEARPWDSEDMSWAFATRRREEGWEPVLEASSTARGVMLSVPLSLEESVTKGAASAVDRDGLVLLGQAEEPHPVRLGVPLKDRAVDTYVLPPGPGSELTWKDLPLTEPARFSALLSANEAARFSSRGVRYRLFANDVLLEEVEFHLTAHERPSWLDWEVEVPVSGELAELKLIMTPLKGSNAAQPQVGAPVLSFDA